MALTRVAPAGIGSTPGTGYVIGNSFLHSRGLNSIDANYTGIVTTQNLRVIGDLEVEGTTTTLDTALTEVDKLEVGANNNTVGVAITQSGSGDILRLYDGASEVFSVADGGAIKIGGAGQLALDVSYDGSSATAAKIVTNTGITNANSTFTFAVNENSGAQMQLKGDGAVIFSEGSTERLRVDSNGLVGINSTAPTKKLDVQGHAVFGPGATRLHTYSDSGYSGIYNGSSLTSDESFYMGAGKLFFCADGGEVIRVLANGRVGIGTNNPTNTLEISKVENHGITLRRPAGGSNPGTVKFEVHSHGAGRLVSERDFNIDFDTDNLGNQYFNVSSNGSERFRITSAGNVGIGTDTFDTNRQLAVYHATQGTIEIKSSDTGQSSLWFSDISDGNVGGVYYEHSNNAMGFRTNDVERLRIDSSGNVGINKNAPTSVLDVRQTNTGAATEIKLFNLDQSNATTQTAALVMTPDVRANGVKIVAVKEVADMSSTANKDLALSFQTVANNTAAERLRITSAGKIGIGHQQEGQITKELTIRPANDGGIRFVRPGAAGASVMSHLELTTTTSGSVFPSGEAYTVKYNTVNNDQIFTTYAGGGTGGNISFQTGNGDGNEVERLRINPDGKVGINTSGPNTVLHIKSTQNSDGLTVTKGSNVSAFLGHNGSGDEGLLTLKEGGTTKVQLYAETGQHSYITSGNFGIGTNGPGAPLHILSTAYPTALIQRNHGTNYPRLRLTNTSNHGADIDGIGDGSPAGGFRISTVNAATSTERFRIYSEGAIRIRGVNRNSPYTVSNTTGTVFILDDTQPSAVGTGGKIVFGSKYHTGTYTMGTAFIGSSKDNAPSNGSNEYEHSLIFGTNSSSGGISEKMRIRHDGKVLLGTQSALSSLPGIQMYLSGGDPSLVGCKADNNPGQYVTLLKLAGYSQSSSSFRENAAILFETNTANNSGNASGRILFRTEGLNETNGPSTRAVITAEGKMGIGNESPSGILDVKSTQTSSLKTFLRLGDSGNGGSYFDFNMSDQSSGADEISHRKDGYVSKNTYGLKISSHSTLQGSYTGAGPASIRWYFPSAGGGNQAGGQLEFWTNQNGYAGTSETKKMQIDNYGNIGAPSGNNIYNASDERLKENMVNLTGCLEKIKQLRPISFTWKDGFGMMSGVSEYGFGAQTTQAVDEILVEPFGEDDIVLDEETIENPLRVNDKYIVPMLVKAVQEQQEQIEALQALVNSLTS